MKKAQNKKILKHLKDSFEVSSKDMRDIIEDFHLEMKKGLSGKKSSLKMLPAFVDRATGKEKGSFIALDLGGTNFRILELELKGGGKSSEPKTMRFILKKKYLRGHGQTLFDFLATSIKHFLVRQKLRSSETLPLGFTFSFPMKQTGIRSGFLVKWTKGFNAKGVLGNDVVRLLEEALKRIGVDSVKISALANDTVGTLVARSYSDPHCDIGVIIGTGTNASYVEATPTGEMIINIEWGNFNRLKTTSYDRQLNRESDKPGEQILEKMVSGMYLGEAARLVLNDLIKQHAIFNGRSCAPFERRDGFTTEHMSIVEGDGSAKRSRTGALLRRLGVPNATLGDKKICREVCRLVSQRGARIVAACLGAIIAKTDPDLAKRHTIAIDGSVYEKHPCFSKNMEQAIREIFGARAAHIKMALTKDGSGKGAAIIAAIAASK